MNFQTLLRDCLYLNWAFPAAALPSIPAPLRYEVHRHEGAEYVFGSAVLFRHSGLHWRGLASLRFSYPQFNLRFYVKDGEGEAAVYFRRILVPPWVVVGARMVARQPARAASFAYPEAGSCVGEGPWSWQVRRGAGLAVSVRPGSAPPGAGPDLGSWHATVRYFRRRHTGYVPTPSGWQRIEANHPTAETCPVRAEIDEHGLLASALELADGAAWPALHSAFLAPEVPFVFVTGGVLETGVAHHVPAPG